MSSAATPAPNFAEPREARVLVVEAGGGRVVVGRLGCAGDLVVVVLDEDGTAFDEREVPGARQHAGGVAADGVVDDEVGPVAGQPFECRFQRREAFAHEVDDHRHGVVGAVDLGDRRGEVRVVGQHLGRAVAQQARELLGDDERDPVAPLGECGGRAQHRVDVPDARKAEEDDVPALGHGWSIARNPSTAPFTDQV